MRNYNIELRTFAARYSYQVRLDNTIIKPIFPVNFFEYSDLKDDLSNKENLFDIDNLYNEICTKPFIFNRKQELLLLIMYYWSTFYNDTNIWKICLESYKLKIDLHKT